MITADRADDMWRRYYAEVSELNPEIMLKLTADQLKAMRTVYIAGIMACFNRFAVIEGGPEFRNLLMWMNEDLKAEAYANAERRREYAERIANEALNN